MFTKVTKMSHRDIFAQVSGSGVTLQDLKTQLSLSHDNFSTDAMPSATDTGLAVRMNSF